MSMHPPNLVFFFSLIFARRAAKRGRSGRVTFTSFPGRVTFTSFPLRTGHHQKTQALPDSRTQSSPMTTNDNGNHSPSPQLREETLKATAPSSCSPYKMYQVLCDYKKLQASNHVLSFRTPERKQHERRGESANTVRGTGMKMPPVHSSNGDNRIIYFVCISDRKKTVI